MSKAIHHFIRRIREGHFHGNARRNFQILLTASFLNLSFALEKLMIVIGYPLPDFVWMILYATLALYLSLIAFSDLAKDMESNEENSRQNII